MSEPRNYESVVSVNCMSSSPSIHPQTLPARLAQAHVGLGATLIAISGTGNLEQRPNPSRAADSSILSPGDLLRKMIASGKSVPSKASVK